MGNQSCCCGNENIHENGRLNEPIMDEHLSKNHFSDTTKPSNFINGTNSDVEDYNNHNYNTNNMEINEESHKPLVSEAIKVVQEYPKFDNTIKRINKILQLHSPGLFKEFDQIITSGAIQQSKSSTNLRNVHNEIVPRFKNRFGPYLYKNSNCLYFGGFFNGKRHGFGTLMY